MVHAQISATVWKQMCRSLTFDSFCLKAAALAPSLRSTWIALVSIKTAQRGLGCEATTTSSGTTSMPSACPASVGFDLRRSRNSSWAAATRSMPSLRPRSTRTSDLQRRPAIPPGKISAAIVRPNTALSSGGTSARSLAKFCTTTEVTSTSPRGQRNEVAGNPRARSASTTSGSWVSAPTSEAPIGSSLAPAALAAATNCNQGK
mmetsp:Transcript_19558/g.53563  ORF Transcript_19558/g.53563 Transcript_19558/m.53563 type:complete len:204 (-) Transcript_19558:556-1167(-)